MLSDTLRLSLVKINLQMNKPVDVLLAFSGGDEGKGKPIDFITPNYDIVADFKEIKCGHTILINGRKFVLI